MVRTCGSVMSMVKMDMLPKRRLIALWEREVCDTGVMGIGGISSPWNSTSVVASTPRCWSWGALLPGRPAQQLQHLPRAPQAEPEAAENRERIRASNSD